MTFPNNSFLNVTYELNTNNKLLFLDVFIDTNNNAFITSPYLQALILALSIIKVNTPNNIK